MIASYLPMGRVIGYRNAWLDRYGLAQQYWAVELNQTARREGFTWTNRRTAKIDH
jgi:hypothetical protein